MKKYSADERFLQLHLMPEFSDFTKSEVLQLVLLAAYFGIIGGLVFA